MATPEERLMYQRGQIDYLEGNEPIDKMIRHRMRMKKMCEAQQKKIQEEKEIKEKGKKIAQEVLKNLQKAFK